MIGSLKIPKIILIFALLLSGGAFVNAEDVTGDTPYWMCKSKHQVRTIRVSINPKSGICSTYYQRDGAEKSVGSGKNHGSCVVFLENIKTNLEKSNWTCRDISSTAITSIQE